MAPVHVSVRGPCKSEWPMLLLSPMLMSSPDMHLRTMSGSMVLIQVGSVLKSKFHITHQRSHRTPVLEPQSGALGIWESMLLPEQSQSKWLVLPPVVPTAQTPKDHQEIGSDAKARWQQFQREVGASFKPTEGSV